MLQLSVSVFVVSRCCHWFLLGACWKKDVILWYEINKNQLPPNVVSKEKVIDMVYNQFMAHRTKPLTIEERLTKLEEHSHEPQNYREECEKMNKQIKILKKQIKILKKKLGK